jgi:hypothetical protein
MDLTKEFDDIQKGKRNPQKILDVLFVEHQELMKKMHIFKSLLISEGIKEMIEANSFHKDDIFAIQIFRYQDDNYSESIKFRVYDLKDKPIEYGGYYGERNNTIGKLLDLFSQIEDFETDNISSDLKSGYHYIELSQGSHEEILKLLLSEELQTMVDYNKMQLDLSCNGTTPKKLKV